MTWTPEMIYGSIGTVGAGLVAIAAALNRFKVVKIPLRRNNGNQSNQFQGMGFSEIEKRCREIHAGVDAKIDTLGKEQSSHEAKIEDIKDRLDKGDNKFDVVLCDIKKISVDIGIMDTKFEMREKSLTDTIKEATQTMQGLLKKSG